MIQNKRLIINLSPVLGLCLVSLVACSSSPKQVESDKPIVDSPAPEELRQQSIETSEPMPATPEPDVPDASPIREGIPDRYTVKKGDTLWDISNYFLKDPWL